MINLMNLFGGAPTMGTSLFGAPKMFEDMPTPGLPATGAADGVAPPPPSLLGGAGGSLLGGAGTDTLKPPVPLPSPGSQVPAPLTGPGSDKLPSPTSPGPTLPNVGAGGVGPDIPMPTTTQGGVGPDVPPTTDTTTTGGVPGEQPPADGEHTNKLADFLSRAGQVKFGGGASGGGGGGGGVGSAGAPHIPQGASQLFQSILEGHQKAVPQAGPVPKLPDYLNRLGLTGRR